MIGEIYNLDMDSRGNGQSGRERVDVQGIGKLCSCTLYWFVFITEAWVCQSGVFINNHYWTFPGCKN